MPPPGVDPEGLDNLPHSSQHVEGHGLDPDHIPGNEQVSVHSSLFFSDNRN